MSRTDVNKDFSAVEVIVAIVIFCSIVLLGLYVQKSLHSINSTYSSATKTSSSNSPKFSKVSKQATASVSAANTYSGWKTYTSSFEKLSFKYPGNWKSVTPAVPSTDPSADSFELESPSGAVTVAWDSEVSGIGGECDNTILPSTTNSSSGPCPYWTVIEKQKLAGADLYYVDGVVTRDGSTYSPWCAIQAPDGILQSESNIGYLLFAGKNNDVVQNGHDYGTSQAGLLCGRPFGGQDLMQGTKAQAITFLSAPEMKQAKLILLSASY